MSYPFAAFLTGLLAERGLDRRYLTSVLAMAAGLAVVFACGVAWLAWFARPAALNLDQALRTGLYPVHSGRHHQDLRRRGGDAGAVEADGAAAPFAAAVGRLATLAGRGRHSLRSCR